MNFYSMSKLLKMGGNNIGYTYRFVLSTIKMLMVYSLHVALWSLHNGNYRHAFPCVCSVPPENVYAYRWLIDVSLECCSMYTVWMSVA